MLASPDRAPNASIWRRSRNTWKQYWELFPPKPHQEANRLTILTQSRPEEPRPEGSTTWRT